MNDNLKPLAELSAEQRLFLKQQVGANVSKYDLQIKRDQARLDSKLDRQAENQERNSALTADLQKKQIVLTALKQAGNVSPEIIAAQEQDVANAQKELDRLQTAPNTLTDVEAYFEQYEIEILKLAKKFYEERSAELNALP